MLIIEKLPTRYSEGSATVVANEVTVTPTDALWYGNVWGDDLFFDPAQPLVPPQRIASVNEDGTLTLAYPWPGDTMTEAPYEIRYIGIIERSTAQTRRVIEELGKISPYYDVQVDTLADRDDYDDRPTGFAVLVADTGDGRSAIYSKASATSGDWSDAAYVTGAGYELEIGTVTKIDYGADPDVTLTPEAGGGVLDFELPGSPDFTIGTVETGDPSVTATPTETGYELDFTLPGFEAEGDYNSGTTYAKGDVVQQSGSSWVALQETTGNAPPSLPTTSDAYWQLLARRGVDGAGTVTAVASGTGITIDSTDPTVPVVSAIIASQAEAEAGTEAAKLMTPERTAQAIAELSPEVPADLYRPNNILGTVSETFGVPTGAIIERGSNANGEYVRFADGTQICWGTRTANLDITVAYWGGFRSNGAAVTYPAVFVSLPSVMAGNSGDPGAFGANAVNTGGVGGTFINFTSVTADDVVRPRVADWMAVGRWF